MKFIITLALLLSASAAFASPIDDVVASYTVVKTLAPVTYKGIPVHGNPVAVCEFLGHKLVLDFESRTPGVGEVYYDLVKNGTMFEFVKFTGSNRDPYATILTKLTCASQ